MNDNSFETLLAKTEAAWQKLPIRIEKWKYAISATEFRPGKGLILGINWGADDKGHEKPLHPGDDHDLSKYRFIAVSRVHLKRILNLNFDEGKFNFNYSNLCFFRSKRVSDLTEAHHKLSIPLFEEYVQHIQPKWIIGFGVTNYTVMNRYGMVDQWNEAPGDGKAFKLYYGRYKGCPIYLLPHPQARVPGERRQQLWDSLEEQLKTDYVQP
jgi:uracil-DNA glycosylase